MSDKQFYASDFLLISPAVAVNIAVNKFFGILSFFVISLPDCDLSK